ncbi:MAG TPA: histidine kinase [Chitinophagaceae bacterium]
MNEFITKPENIRRLEFWAATTIYVFAIFLNISFAVRADGALERAALNDYVYVLVSRLIRFTVLYGAFLFLNFYLVPRLLRREALVVNILTTILLFVLMGGIFAVTNTFLKYNMVPGSYKGGVTHNVVFGNSFLYAAWLMLLYGIYTALKWGTLRLLERTRSVSSKRRTIIHNGLTAFLLWIISLFGLAVAAAEEEEFVMGWAVVSAFTILFYGFCYYWLIPRALPRKRPFLFFLTRSVLVLAISIFPMFLLLMPVLQDEDPALAIAMLNSVFQLCLIAPLAWVLFKRHMRGNEELVVLKKELGQTHANFDFLRSQINPHFLFNALNTIYGTALQEGAERTGEGVQRLGDMMRFMLQENMQDKIPLAREIEYLNNYISLQRLRTDASPVVKIESTIECPVTPVQIAPMLLIPFVENAFKHGISFREPSHIKIALEVRDHTLNFDVYNSKHLRSDSDPEKDKSGIGLNNVKQRLSLLYPGKHELIIRETGKEFFVHLTIQLT